MNVRRSLQSGRRKSQARPAATRQGPTWVGIAAILLLFGFDAPSIGETWEVPEEIPTIEEALAIAQPHDTVLVSPGVYYVYDPLSMSTASVTLLSEELEGALLRGYSHLLVVSADSCVVASFLLFVDYTYSIVAIQPNVTATLIELNYVVGGGIATGVYDAGRMTRVRGNTIEDCWIPVVANGVGTMVDSNTIRDNFAGVQVYAEANVIGNVITGALGGIDTGGSLWGGGILIWGVHGPVEVRGNQIFDNQCDSFDFESIGRGGGIHVRYSDSVLIEGNRIYGNQAVHGGGIYAQNSSVEISHNVVWANRDSTGMPGDPRRGTGGGLWIGNCDGVVEGNTIVGNMAGIEGGGVYLEGPNCPAFVGNIIAANESPGSGFSCQQGSADLECNDVWGNGSTDFGGDCEDPTGMNGNISADPMFCYPDTGNFCLEPDSPCAPENSPPGCGLIGAHGIGCDASHVTEAPGSGVRVWLHAFPNPAKGVVTILFSGPPEASGSMDLGVFDVSGRPIRRFQQAGKASLQSVVWDRQSSSGKTVPSGVYFIRLLGGDKEIRSKILLIE